MNKLEDGVGKMGNVLEQITPQTRKRSFATNLAGILCGTGLALGVDYLGNGQFDNPLLDVAAGSGLYDGVSAGFGKGILGLGIATSPEILDFVRYAIAYKAQAFSEFVNTESFENLAYKILTYGGMYVVGTALRYSWRYLHAVMANRIIKR